MAAFESIALHDLQPLALPSRVFQFFRVSLHYSKRPPQAPARKTHPNRGGKQAQGAIVFLCFISGLQRTGCTGNVLFVGLASRMSNFGFPSTLASKSRLEACRLRIIPCNPATCRMSWARVILSGFFIGI